MCRPAYDFNCCFCPILTPQSASANVGGFDCYGQPDCVNGWNTGIGQATQDYNYNHGYNGKNGEPESRVPPPPVMVIP